MNDMSFDSTLLHGFARLDACSTALEKTYIEVDGSRGGDRRCQSDGIHAF